MIFDNNFRVDCKTLLKLWQFVTFEIFRCVNAIVVLRFDDGV